MTPADEATFIALWQQGLETAAIAQRLGIPPGTARSRAYSLQQQGKIAPRPRGGRRTPARALTDGTLPAHQNTPKATKAGHTTVHLSPPAGQSTLAHQSVPLPQELAARLLMLLPELETLVARERDRQRVVSTPLGTPQSTVKKTYVVDTLYVDLIECYARDEGLELKDVVNLAFQEFFEQRRYLPEE